MSPRSDGKSSPSQSPGTQDGVNNDYDGSNYGSGDNGVFRDDGETGGTIAVAETSQKNNSGSGSVEGKSKNNRTNNLRRSLRLRNGKHTTVNNNTSAGEKREAVDSSAPSESSSNKRRSTHNNGNDVSAIGSRHLHLSSSSTSIGTTNALATLRNRCLSNCRCATGRCRPNVTVTDVVQMVSTQYALVTESFPNYTFSVKFEVGNGKEESIVIGDGNTYGGIELDNVPWHCLLLAEPCNPFGDFKYSWGLDGYRVMVKSLPASLMSSVVLCDGPNSTTIICAPEDATTTTNRVSFDSATQLNEDEDEDEENIQMVRRKNDIHLLSLFVCFFLTLHF